MAGPTYDTFPLNSRGWHFRHVERHLCINCLCVKFKQAVSYLYIYIHTYVSTFVYFLTTFHPSKFKAQIDIRRFFACCLRAMNLFIIYFIACKQHEKAIIYLILFFAQDALAFNSSFLWEILWET